MTRGDFLFTVLIVVAALNTVSLFCQIMGMRARRGS